MLQVAFESRLFRSVEGKEEKGLGGGVDVHVGVVRFFFVEGV